MSLRCTGTWYTVITVFPRYAGTWCMHRNNCVPYCRCTGTWYTVRTTCSLGVLVHDTPQAPLPGRLSAPEQAGQLPAPAYTGRQLLEQAAQLPATARTGRQLLEQAGQLPAPAHTGIQLLEQAGQLPAPAYTGSVTRKQNVSMQRPFF